MVGLYMLLIYVIMTGNLMTTFSNNVALDVVMVEHYYNILFI